MKALRTTLLAAALALPAWLPAKPAKAFILDICAIDCRIYLILCCPKPCPVIDVPRLAALAKRLSSTAALVNKYSAGVTRVSNVLAKIGENIFYPDPIIDMLKQVECKMPEKEDKESLDDLEELFNPEEGEETEKFEEERRRSMHEAMLRKAKQTISHAAQSLPEMQRAWADAERQMLHAEQLTVSASDNREALRALAAAQQSVLRFQAITQEGAGWQGAIRGSLLAGASSQ